MVLGWDHRSLPTSSFTLTWFRRMEPPLTCCRISQTESAFQEAPLETILRLAVLAPAEVARSGMDTALAHEAQAIQPRLARACQMYERMSLALEAVLPTALAAGGIEEIVTRWTEADGHFREALHKLLADHDFAPLRKVVEGIGGIRAAIPLPVRRFTVVPSSRPGSVSAFSFAFGARPDWPRPGMESRKRRQPNRWIGGDQARESHRNSLVLRPKSPCNGASRGNWRRRGSVAGTDWPGGLQGV